MSARFPVPQRDTEYQPRATLWVGDGAERRKVPSEAATHFPRVVTFRGTPPVRENVGRGVSLKRRLTDRQRIRLCLLTVTANWRGLSETLRGQCVNTGVV